MSSDRLQEKKYFRQREDPKSRPRCMGPEVVFRKLWVNFCGSEMVPTVRWIIEAENQPGSEIRIRL